MVLKATNLLIFNQSSLNIFQDVERKEKLILARIHKGNTQMTKFTNTSDPLTYIACQRANTMKHMLDTLSNFILIHLNCYKTYD